MSVKSISFIFILALILPVLSFLPLADSQGFLQPYFDGEAINYQGHIIFGTTNTGRFELFNLSGSRIVPVNAINSEEEKDNDFFDLIFNEENSSLYVYLVNGRYLYKYDISNGNNIYLKKKVSDNAGDYFYGLGRAGANIFTIGRKGMKVWNNNLLVINSYDNMSFKYPKSLKFSSNGNYIFNANGSSLKVFDSFYRDQILATGLTIKGEHSLHPYNDDKAGIVYVVDDYSLKKVKIDGSYNEFKHISNIGYDVDSTVGSKYVYFSDGIGIVKTKKSDLKPVNWAYTTSLGGGNGWSMGLRAVAGNTGEFVIVFNGSSILVFDGQLTLLDYYRARERRENLPVPMSLSLDRNRAASDSQISLQGSGFGLNEDIKIKFGDDYFYTSTDNNRQFQTILTVPRVNSKYIDIKVNGLSTGLTYSINFFVE